MKKNDLFNIAAIIIAGVVAFLLPSLFSMKALWAGVVTFLTFILCFGIIKWVQYTIIALKDPDVQDAGRLQMSTSHFRKYKELSEELKKAMDKMDEDSLDRFFDKNIKPQIKDEKEWKRFLDYVRMKRNGQW